MTDIIAQSLGTVSDALDSAGIPYMVVGGLATFVHGEPRTTRDADIAVDAASVGVAGVAAVLAGAGLTTTSVDRSEFGLRLWVRSTPFPVEVFLTGGHGLHEREFGRAAPHDFGLDRPLPVISAEDLLLRKLVNLRLRRSETDVQDIVSIIGKRADLDLAYIRRHAPVHRVARAFERFLREVRGTADGG